MFRTMEKIFNMSSNDVNLLQTLRERNARNRIDVWGILALSFKGFAFDESKFLQRIAETLFFNMDRILQSRGVFFHRNKLITIPRVVTAILTHRPHNTTDDVDCNQAPSDQATFVFLDS